MPDQQFDVFEGEDEKERLWEALRDFKGLVRSLVELTGLSTNVLADTYHFGKGKVATWQNATEQPNIPPLRFVEVLIKEAKERANLQDGAAAAFLRQYGELLELYCARAKPHNVHRQMLAEYQSARSIRELNEAMNATQGEIAGLTDERETLRGDRDEERRRRIALQQQIDSLKRQNQSRAVEKNAAIAQRDKIHAGLEEYERESRVGNWTRRGKPGANPGAGDQERPGPGTQQPLVKPTRKPAITIGIVIALLVAGAGTYAGLGHDDSKQPSAPPLAICRNPTQTLNITSSTEKSAVLKDLADGYQARSSHGQCVKVVVGSVDSGTAARALASGWKASKENPVPDVWSPASQAWLQIARQQATDKGTDKSTDKGTGSRLPQSAGKSIVTSPLTIAMPESIARKQDLLGKKLISWKEFSALAKKPDFKLGKTNPETSTSGLNATIASFHTQTSELSRADLKDPVNRERVSAIEKAAVHYGDTTLTFLANLRRYDDAGDATSYISAVTVEESSVVAYNEGYPCGSQSNEPGCEKKGQPETKLVAFYPTNDSGGGTIYSDHPYIKLTGLSPAKGAVADAFLGFLASEEAQARFAAQGFRTPSKQTAPKFPSDFDALPADRLPTALQAPSDGVLDELLTVWRELRKTANVLILMDTSGSMNWNAKDKKNRIKEEPSKLDLVKQALDPLLDGFTDSDKVGLWHFSTSPVADNALNAMGAKEQDGKTHRSHIEDSVGELKTDSDTALYTTIDDAVKQLRANYDPSAINAVVVLTDGKNETSGGPSLEGLRNTISDPNKDPVRVFTIAYGAQADTKALQEIAEATHARAYDASNPNAIADVLANVISNF